MLVTIKIDEIYTKYCEIKIPDTGNINETYESIDKVLRSGKISRPSTEVEPKFKFQIIK